MALEPGSRLGDYRIVAKIGYGGQADVYEAVQDSIHRRVALKVLPERFAGSAEPIARLYREAEAGGRLSHPNIVQVHEVGAHGAVHFIAMEYLAGPSLERLIADTRKKTSSETPTSPAVAPPPPEPAGTEELGAAPVRRVLDRAYVERIVRLMIDVLRALDHAHRNGVIHRDVKPNNLILDAEGRVKVTDFGLARLAESPGLTQPGQIFGTPWYMSPERAMQGRIPVDHRTDVYSAGVTLFELLTLERPFRGDDTSTVLRAIIHKEPPSPRAFNPSLPRDLSTVVLKAMEKDPARRYRTAGAFADDLRRFLDYEDVEARPVGLVGRLARRVAKHKALATAGGALVVALAAAAAVAASSAARRRNEADSRALRAVVLLAEQDFDAARLEAESALRLVPSHALAASVSRAAAGGRDARFTADEAGARITVARYVPSRAAFRGEEVIGVVGAAGGEIVAALDPGEYVAFAESPDGRHGERWLSVSRDMEPDVVRLTIPDGDEGGDRMVEVPAGAYTIGDDDDPAASPSHRVTLGAFLVDDREATNERFDRFVRAAGRPARLPREGWPDGRTLDPAAARLPIRGLSWLEANEFLASEGKRLPTEAEWEAAARGPAGNRFPWGNEWNPARVAVVPKDGPPPPAGSRGGPGSGYAFGLFDMIGGVPEWTASRFVAYPGWPGGPAVFSASQRVHRGLVLDPARDLWTSSRRHSHPPHFDSPGIGVRGVRSMRRGRHP